MSRIGVDSFLKEAIESNHFIFLLFFLTRYNTIPIITTIGRNINKSINRIKSICADPGTDITLNYDL